MILDFQSQLERIINLELSNLNPETPEKHEQTGDILYKLGKDIQYLSLEELEDLRKQVEKLNLEKYKNNPDYQKIEPRPIIESNHYFPENRGYLLHIFFRKADRHFSNASQNGNLKNKLKKAKCRLELGKLSEKIHDANKSSQKKYFEDAKKTFSDLEQKTKDFEDLSYYQFLKGDAQLKLADLDKNLDDYLEALQSLEKSYHSYKRVIGNQILNQKHKYHLSKSHAKIAWTYFKIGKSISESDSIEEKSELINKILKTEHFTKFNFAIYCFNTAKEYLTKARDLGDTSVESKSKTGSCYFALAQLKFKRWKQLDNIDNLPENIMNSIPYPKKKLEKEINQDLNNSLAWYNIASRQDPDFFISSYFKCLIASEFKNMPFKLNNKFFENPDQPWEEFYHEVTHSPRYLRWEMTRSNIGVVMDRHGLIERSSVLKRSNHLERVAYEELHEFNEYMKYVLNIKKFYSLPKIIYSLPNIQVLVLEHGQKTLYEKAKIIAKDIKTDQENIKKMIAQGKRPEYFRKRLRELKRKRTQLYMSAIQQLIRIDYGLYKVMPNIIQRMELEHPTEAKIERLKEKRDYTHRFKKVVIQNNPFQEKSLNSLENIMEKFSEKISGMKHFIYSDCNPCNFSEFVIDHENIKEMAYLFDAAILLYHEGPDFKLKDIRKLFRQVVYERAKIVDRHTTYQTISQEKKDEHFRDFDYISVFRLFTLIGNEQVKINHRLKKMPEPKKTYWRSLLVQRQHLYLDYIKEIAQYALSDRCTYHQKQDKKNFKKLYQVIKDYEIFQPILQHSQSRFQAAS